MCRKVSFLREISRIKLNIGGLRNVTIACKTCDTKAARREIFEVNLPSNNSASDARRRYALVYSLSLLLSPEWIHFVKKYFQLITLRIQGKQRENRSNYGL